MRGLSFILLILTVVIPSCGFHQREEALQLKEAELNQKEQQLILKEKSLQLREEEVEKKEKRVDSSSNKNLADTLSILFPSLGGTWNVTMKCTETTCQGSAVGDTKTEQWEINIENNTIIARAMSDKKLNRIYSGSYVGNGFELLAQQEDAAAPQAAKMIVRLQITKENEMTGQREIIRQNECRIMYALELRKL